MASINGTSPIEIAFQVTNSNKPKWGHKWGQAARIHILNGVRPSGFTFKTGNSNKPTR